MRYLWNKLRKIINHYIIRNKESDPESEYMTKFLQKEIYIRN